MIVARGIGLDIEDILNSKPVIYRKIMETLVSSYEPLYIKEIAEKVKQSEKVVYNIVKVYPKEIIEAEYDEEKGEYTGRYSAGKQCDFYLK